jgi:hypothetical protein
MSTSDTVAKVTQKQITTPQRNYVTRFLDEKSSLSGVLHEKPRLAMHDIYAPRVTRYVSQPISVVRERRLSLDVLKEKFLTI